MKLSFDDHDAIIAISIPLIAIVYVIVFALFFKTLDKDSMEFMNKAVLLNRWIGYAGMAIGISVGRVRNMIIKKIKINKPENWNIYENIYIRLMTYFMYTCASIGIGSFLWGFALIGVYTRNLRSN
ncbi:hypothetical protein [Stenoxybacter acetivorans]|uniref:hypothetical protein n=1 Tax=Stenoxybacter acetivorans TaxID=422441 RepID=UPI000568EB3F|nr:hypothetical protein [Stenoxybacter acetivorans]